MLGSAQNHPGEGGWFEFAYGLTDTLNTGLRFPLHA